MTLTRWLLAGAALYVVFALISNALDGGTSSESDGPSSQAEAPNIEPAPPTRVDDPDPPPPPTRTPGAISRADTGRADWPLTVPRGVVNCIDTSSVTFTAPNGVEYAVNGTARTLHPDMPEIELIWKKPDSYGLRVNISPIIDKGLALC